MVETLARLERLTGPDPALDARIARLCDLPPAPFTETADAMLLLRPAGRGAALVLTELGDGSPWHAVFVYAVPSLSRQIADGGSRASLAIAGCIAFLRARVVAR